MICIHCDRDFNPNNPRHKAGKINECGNCAQDVKKTIGLTVVSGKTDYHTELIKNPTPNQIMEIKKAGAQGPTHCHSSLGLNSNGSTTPKDKIDEVQESLEKSSESEKGRLRYNK